MHGNYSIQEYHQHAQVAGPTSHRLGPLGKAHVISWYQWTNHDRMWLAGGILRRTPSTLQGAPFFASEQLKIERC